MRERSEAVIEECGQIGSLPARRQRTMPLRAMEHPWGPDGIFVYGGARCNPARGIPMDFTYFVTRFTKILRFFHIIFTKFSGSFHVTPISASCLNAVDSLQTL